MYLRYAERRGWKTEVLDASESDLGGYKDVSVAVKARGTSTPGEGVWSRLKYEGGVHRVQRVPVTESQGRIHTSAAGVLVLPEAEDVEVEIDPNDLRIDVYRSSRPGRSERQHHRLRGAHHPPADRHRRQLPEREEPAAEPESAMRILRARLSAMQRPSEPRRSRTPHVPPRLCAVLLAGAIGAAFGATAHAGLGTAVEFYNAKINHYFITAYPEEAAALDAGTNVKGWTRTGGQFTVFTEPAEGLQAVCRFFGTPGEGPNSHFYTADAAECAKVKTLPGVDVRGHRVLHPDADQRRLRRQLAGVSQLLLRQHRRRQPPLHGGPDRARADDAAARRHPRRRRDVRAGDGRGARGGRRALPGAGDARADGGAGRGGEGEGDREVAGRADPDERDAVHAVPVLGSADGQLAVHGRPRRCRSRRRSTAARYKQSPSPVGWEFFRQSKTAPDQLRLRMAHVWHQIFVVSSDGTGETYAHAEFQQRLRDGAFGTFENLLAKYALSPQLGCFQNWVKNVPEHDGIRPNENFARELMQLFTIGVNELNDDGTPKLDANGQLVADLRAGRHRDAGARADRLHVPDRGPGRPPTSGATGTYYIGDMIPFDAVPRHRARRARSAAASTSGRAAARRPRCAAPIRALVDHPEHAAVHRQAADPEDRDQLAHAGVRRARRRRVQGQRQRRARRPGRGDARDPARPGGARRAQDRHASTGAARAGAVLDRDDPRARRRRPTACSRTARRMAERPEALQRADGVQLLPRRLHARRRQHSRRRSSASTRPPSS